LFLRIDKNREASRDRRRGTNQIPERGRAEEKEKEAGTKVMKKNMRVFARQKRWSAGLRAIWYNGRRKEKVGG